MKSFFKEVDQAIVLRHIATICRNLTSKTLLKHVLNCSKRFIGSQISRKMKKKKLLCAFEKKFLITYNFDKF